MNTTALPLNNCPSSPNYDVAEFMKRIQHLCQSLQYLGESDGVPKVLADPLIIKGRDRLDLYLYPRYKMWMGRDDAGRTIMKAGPNWRRISVDGQPLDIHLVAYG